MMGYSRILASLLTLVLVLSACAKAPVGGADHGTAARGQNGTAAPVPPTPPPVDPPGLTTLKLYAPYAFTGAIISGFQAKYPQYRVDVIPVPGGGAGPDPALVRELIDKGEIDVIQMDYDRLGFLITENRLLHLDPYIQKTKFDLAPLGPTAEQLRWDGHLLDLPGNAVPNVLLYNKERWRAAGLGEPPSSWTWEQFREAAKRLTTQSGSAQVWGFTATWQPNLVNMWVFQKAGRLPMEASETDMKEALEFFSTLIFADKSMKPDPLLNRPGWSPQRDFHSGKAGMFLGSIRELGLLGNQKAVKWDLLPFPSVDGGRPAATVTPMTYAIPATTKHPDAAWAFLSFLAGEEGAMLHAKSGTLPLYQTPAVRDAWFEHEVTRPPGTAKLFDTTWVVLPRTLGGPGPGLRVNEIIADAISGRVPWEQAYAEYQQVVRDYRQRNDN